MYCLLEIIGGAKPRQPMQLYPRILLIVATNLERFTFSHLGHALASIHFNFNVLRDVRKNADGTEQLNVTYPKFKNGEATVKNIRIFPNYGM